MCIRDPLVLCIFPLSLAAGLRSPVVRYREEGVGPNPVPESPDAASESNGPKGLRTLVPWPTCG